MNIQNFSTQNKIEIQKSVTIVMTKWIRSVNLNRVHDEVRYSKEIREGV